MGILEQIIEEERQEELRTTFYPALGFPNAPFVCRKCACPVADRGVHLAWHKRIGD